jgi:hypothetical protein
MRASELAREWAAEINRLPREYALPPSDIRVVYLLAILARHERAIERLAADAGTGPAERIKAILDGEDGTGHETRA